MCVCVCVCDLLRDGTVDVGREGALFQLLVFLLLLDLLALRHFLALLVCDSLHQRVHVHDVYRVPRPLLPCMHYSALRVCTRIPSIRVPRPLLPCMHYIYIYMYIYIYTYNIYIYICICIYIYYSASQQYSALLVLLEAIEYRLRACQYMHYAFLMTCQPLQ